MVGDRLAAGRRRVPLQPLPLIAWEEPRTSARLWYQGRQALGIWSSPVMHVGNTFVLAHPGRATKSTAINPAQHGGWTSPIRESRLRLPRNVSLGYSEHALRARRSIHILWAPWMGCVFFRIRLPPSSDKPERPPLPAVTEKHPAESWPPQARPEGQRCTEIFHLRRRCRTPSSAHPTRNPRRQGGRCWSHTAGIC